MIAVTMMVTALTHRIIRFHRLFCGPDCIYGLPPGVFNCLNSATHSVTICQRRSGFLE